MDALDLHVEHGSRVHSGSPVLRAIKRARSSFAARRWAAKSSMQGRVIGVIGEPEQGLRLIEHLRPGHLDSELRQTRIGLLQPAAKGDAIGLC